MQLQAFHGSTGANHVTVSQTVDQLVTVGYDLCHSFDVLD
jgi:hypothetical protein